MQLDFRDQLEILYSRGKYLVFPNMIKMSIRKEGECIRCGMGGIAYTQQPLHGKISRSAVHEQTISNALLEVLHNQFSNSQFVISLKLLRTFLFGILYCALQYTTLVMRETVILIPLTVIFIFLK